MKLIQSKINLVEARIQQIGDSNYLNTEEKTIKMNKKREELKDLQKQLAALKNPTT